MSAVTGSSEYRVLDPTAPRRAADPIVRKVTQQLTDAITASTPVETGKLRAGWHMVKNSDSNWVIANDVPYARYVEYGTRHMAARPMMGRNLANAKARYE